MSIGKKIENIIHVDKENLEKLKEMLPIWRESYKLSMENAEKSFVQLIFFFLFFFLINAAEVTEVNLFGIKFNSLSVPYALLFILSAITFYRFVSISCFAQLIEEAIRHANYQIFQDFQKKGLMDLGNYSSVPQIENCFANLEDKKSSCFTRIGNLFVIAQSLVLGVFPLLALISASYALIKSEFIGNSWSIVLICISWIFILRALILIVQWLRYY